MKVFKNNFDEVKLNGGINASDRTSKTISPKAKLSRYTDLQSTCRALQKLNFMLYFVGYLAADTEGIKPSG